MRASEREASAQAFTFGPFTLGSIKKIDPFAI
jgi:hypothetical protein